MTLTEEQVQALKKRLETQIQHLPDEQKAEAQRQIDNMSPEALESMLKMEMAQQKEQGISSGGTQEVFRAIIDEKIPSKKVSENKDAIAVLDIKPISRGHLVIIPKKQAKEEKDIASGCIELAKELEERMKEILKVEKVEIVTENKFGEFIINVIPVYDTPVSLHSSRTEPSDEDLSKIYSELYEKPKLPLIKIEKPKPLKKTLKMKRKIP